METLQTNMFGVCGIIGDSLTPEILAKHVNAFAQSFIGQKIVVGGDSRTSRSFIRPLVKSILIASGCYVIDIGINPTPTVQLIVKKLNAAGGIIITAEHNPIQWNGLKFVNAEGMFLSSKAMNEVFQRIATRNRGYANWKCLGEEEVYDSAIQDHLNLIYNLPYIDIEAIRRQKYKIALDCVNGTGGKIIPELLEHFGCKVVGLNLEPSGIFDHTPDLTSQNFEELARVVKENNMDLGFAVEPGGARCGLVGNDGSWLGEEYTLVNAIKLILSKKPGKVVVNISTSRAVDEVVKSYDCQLWKTPVSEVNVVQKMKQVNAVIGGEGNGGVILPDVHYARDASVAIALTLQHLTEFGKSVCELKQNLPQYYLLKDKISLDNINPDQMVKEFSRQYQGEELLDFTDGVRIDRSNCWMHLRKSNDEPVMRIIVEARTPEVAWRILKKIKATIGRASFI